MLFVSYASHDRAAIDRLLSTFRRARLQVWLDDELGGGEAWWRTILDQIRACEVFISAVSDNSLASKPCQAELCYAEALQRPILPVQIGPIDSVRVTPLAATQIFDYRKATKPTDIRLIEAVQKRRASIGPLPSRLPKEPPVPFAYLMRLASSLASPELSRHQQSELVTELRERLDEDGHDPAARQDITRLLCLLHNRPDVTWRIRTDIDNLLASIDPNSWTPSTAGTCLPFSGPQPIVVPPTSTGPQAVTVPPWSSGPQPAVVPPMSSGPQPVVVPPPNHDPASDDNGEASTNRRWRSKWLKAGAAGLAALVAVALVVVLTRPAPKPDPLSSMLLSAADVNAIMGTSDMTPVEGDTKGPKQSSGAINVAPPECMGALYPGVDRAYQDSGQEHLTWTLLEKQGGAKRAGATHNHHFVDQDIAAFPPGQNRALAFAQQSAHQWKDCTGKTVTATYTDGDHHTYTWLIGNLTSETPTISQSYTQKDGNGYACQRVLSAVSNFVIDVKACGDHVGDAASQIADTIASRVAQGPSF
ncbi:MAG: sensor domain-containing protein [Mycobacterium sp.]